MDALRDLQLAEGRGPAPGRGAGPSGGVPRLGLGGGAPGATPKLGLPALSLSGVGGGPGGHPPETARGPRASEEQATEAGSAGELGRSVSEMHARGAPGGGGPGKRGRRVELLTPALSLGAGGGNEQGDGAWEDELGIRLGLEPRDLEFFRLEPLSTADVGGLGLDSVVGVRVKGSTFSLEALEATLSENRRLLEQDETRAQTLRALEQHVELQNEVVRENDAKLADATGKQHSAEALLDKTLRELAEVRAERDHLKEKLKQSEGIRDRGSAALKELKREFQALTDGVTSGSDTKVATGAPTPAPAAAGGGPSDRRVESMLERLSSPEVLQSLEGLLQKLP